MTNKWKKISKLTTVMVLASSITIAVASCGNGGDRPYDIEKRSRTGWKDEREYTYNDYTSQMPDVWNSILTSDNINIGMASYLNGSFFEYNYRYEESGEMTEGGYTVDYSAAVKLEDVTSDYVGRYGITEEMAQEGHHAFAITLRDDLEWDDGTPIQAEDFVYTMAQQLSPDYLFTTASNYYSGNYIIHNAKEYVYQGQSDYFDNVLVGFTFGDLSENNGSYTLGGKDCYIALKSALKWLSGNTLEFYVTNYGSYFDVEAYQQLAALADDGGRVKVTATSLSLLTKVITAVEDWGEGEEDVVNYMYVDYTYPELEFSEVGFFVGDNEYELVIVIDNTLSPLDDEGNLTYEAAYYLESFPLVKRSLWESCENHSTTPWTNTYCSGSVANSASWGPYKVSNYQAGVTYTLSRNNNWYGYKMAKYDDQYQTDRMVTRYVPEWNTAWQMFQRGEIDAVSMDASISEQYRNSRQAYFTPESYTFSLNLQSKPDSRTAARNNLLLKFKDFRQAISLALNRDDYCAKNSPSSQSALGYLNEMYYYDVEGGGIYRHTIQAKEAILNAYGAERTDAGWKVGTVEYTDIDEAIDAVTGYNLTLARQLMGQAYEEAKAAGDYSDGEKIVLTYGIETQTANTDRVLNWFQQALDSATQNTPLQGKIEIRYFMFSSATWSQQFMNGEYDLCFGAWGSAEFNPYYLLGETQISSANRYAQGWDPDATTLTISITGDELHQGGSFTMNLTDWNNCLQGKSGAQYNFSVYPVEDKLTILGALEAEILQAYWAIPVFSRYSANLISYKCDYVSYAYNTFLGYGGIRYITYHFDDAEWAEFVKGKGGTLNYLFGRDD